jgi:transposase
MRKTYRPYDPDQPLLMPQSVRDFVPEGDIAHCIDDVVAALDLRAIESVYEREVRGYPPYHPQMMTRLWLYAYAVGATSSRKLAQLARRDVGCMMLAAGNRPDFRTLARFRERHLEELAGLFKQVLRLCRQRGLVGLRHVAIDGTKLRANASKHSAMSYGYMRREEQRISAEVDAWFAEVGRVDAQEDARLGAARDDDDALPPQLRTAVGRRTAIREAMAALEEEARAAGREEPEERAQRNFTDPESRIMRGGDGGFIQAYNAQAAVDAKHQIIVAAMLTPMAADAPLLIPMVDLVRSNLGRNPRQVSADAGYCSEASLAVLAGRKLDAFIATGRMPRSYRQPAAPRGRIPTGLTERERMARKLLTQLGHAIYRLRPQVVEPTFGQIKNKGLVRLLLRGKVKCAGEWLLHCTGHNLLKLHQAWT